MIKRICPQHKKKLVRSNTKFGPLYKCSVEGCTVACWGNSTSTPADQETRDARQELHDVFDAVWRDKDGIFNKEGKKNTKSIRRKRAYQWLSIKMKLERRNIHIGYFNKGQCKEALKYVQLIVGAAQW